jgi:L-ribulose-5-phosphate 3-epimerase
MKKIERRTFMKDIAAVSVASLITPGDLYDSGSVQEYKGGDVGIYISSDGKGVDAMFKYISDLGFSKCELYTNQYTPDMVKPLNEAISKYNMEVLALFTLGPGPTTWDFYKGQQNIGLVSREHRAGRVAAMLQLSDLAKACGVRMIETHVGYIPENPNDPNYTETVEALKKVVGHCARNDQWFLYHAGQESPTTLLRTIQDVGYDNQGIGMDTANLIMYGRGHPSYSLEVYGKYIKLVNAKDGLYPVNPRDLGKEVQVGKGKVDFPRFIKKLKEIGYNGPVLIERESAKGEEWERDVLQSREYLRILLQS